MDLFHSNAKKRPRTDSEKSLKKDESFVSEDDVKSEPPELTPAIAYDSGTEVLKGFEPSKAKVKTYAKKKKKDLPKIDTDNEDEVGPEWIDGEPQGIESYIVDGNDVAGPRRSIIVADKRLPPGWQKHFTQRRTGSSAGKWDVLFIHKSSGKKFRSRNDIRSFMENHGMYDFEPEKFDFCIHRKKNNKSSSVKAKQEPPAEVPKKIKTLLPKAKTPLGTPEVTTPCPVAPVVMPLAITPVTSADPGAVFIGGIRVEMEDSAYKCPKEGCNKNFRKENLLQMHIKHYHPEYSKFLGSTPNVADLAYARTIGESIEDIIPKKQNNFMEKINKFEKKKATQEKQIPENESDVIRPEKTVNVKEDSKSEVASPSSRKSIDVDEDIIKNREASCAMSPGTLFDLKVRDEKVQTGIKTLLPVRSVTTTPLPSNCVTELQKLDRSKSLDEPSIQEKGKTIRKRQTSEYNSDTQLKYKKKQGLLELKDDYGDLDDSTLDVEEPVAPTYRFSRRKSNPKSDENNLTNGDGVMMMINGELVKVEQLRREEIINCTCGFMEEDGLMIQCDLCLCWQHGHCNAIEQEKDVPEKYVCYICQNPYRQRPSKKYSHDQDWIKEGKLPSLSSRSKNQAAIDQRAAMLKRSYDLVAALLQIQQILHSLRVKINVAQKKDHPKLYLWAKNWEKTEIPKPNTELVPIMEIVKPALETAESSLDSSPCAEIKTEIKEEPEDETHKKSIASNTELMKILEEDSLHAEELKNVKKHENQSEGHILLEALTRSNLEKTASEVKNEDNNPPKNTASTSETPDLIPSIPVEKTEPESTNLNEMLPLQPFIPEPEAPIDPAECRSRLLEHIDHFQNHIDSRLTTIETHVIALEAMDPDDPASGPDFLPRTKQTVQMLLRDLATVRKLAALC